MIALPLFLAASCDVQWTADARFAYVHANDVQALGGADEASAIELATGKKSSWPASRGSCMSGDDSEAGERAVKGCSAEREKAERGYDKDTNAWLKAHALSKADDGDAKSSAPSSTAACTRSSWSPGARRA